MLLRNLIFWFRFTIWLKRQLFCFWSSIQTFRLFWIGLWIGASPEMTRLLTVVSLLWPLSLLQGKPKRNKDFVQIFLGMAPAYAQIESLAL